MMKGSYQRKVLRVNLSDGIISHEALKNEWADRYIGGKGLGIRYFLGEVPRGVDPLGEKNVIILMNGPLAGTPVSSTSKLTIVSRSPLTGTILDSSVGGCIGARLKFAGYDGVIISGKSEKPVYLAIDGEKVEIRDASALWGKGIFETEDDLYRALGSEEFSFLTIGPAGEHLVPFSCAGSDRYRQAGRGGIGAVMGSKNLKAIAVRGKGFIPVDDALAFLKEVHAIMKEEVLTPDNLWAYYEGTPMIVKLAQGSGLLPTRNFKFGTFDQYQELSSDAVEKLRKGKKACFGCALACGNFIKAGETTIEGPEYETLALCGSNCGIGDIELVARFNKKCDDLGLDTISTGNVTAFAMELTEQGIRDFGIRFGDREEYLKIPEEIAYKRGPRAELGLGTKALAAKYGGAEFAMHVKGLEFPGYEPRGSWGMGLAYATSDRGACHLRAWTVAGEAFGTTDPYTLEGKAQMVIDFQNLNAFKFSLPICDFWAASTASMARLLPFALGKEMTEEEIIRCGERIWNIGRLFNVREGFRRQHDSLPGRIHDEGLCGGAAEGKKIPREAFDGILQEYYRLRGWTDEGIPERQKLQDLRIEEELAAWV
jgi:aldehyde:ferredoxin oxidoreductase